MRRLLLALTIAFAAPAPAAAAGPVCKVPGPVAKAEKDLREQIRLRKQYGFRSDRAYVQALIARGATDPIEGVTATPAELRYLERRRTVTPGAAVTRYLRKHPEISGWWDVRDDWPRGAYAAVFLTDDSPAQRARIKRLAAFPAFTRVVKVRYSDRQRERVENRIERDEKVLAKAGFEAVETDTGDGTDRVDVSVVSQRKDVARYFKRRYGSMVRTHVTPETTVPGCARASTYTIAPDGLSLTVSWSDAPKAQRLEVTEYPDFVAVGIAVRYSVYPSGFGDPGGTATASLKAPLGNRPVYDAYDGSRLLQTGPSPGDPPCPEPDTRERTPLEQAIAEREDYGMNTDPAYVQTLVDAGRTYTEDEQAWLDRYRDSTYESKVDDYLQHWRQDWGGNSVYAQYPNPPIVVIRFLRRQALHTRRIKALSKYPDQIRTIASTVQRDVFYDLVYVIGDEARANGGFLDGYGRDGFYTDPGEGDGQESTQTVDIDVITTRTDAAEYFTRRFGPLVRVRVIGDRYECRGSYRR